MKLKNVRNLKIENEEGSRIYRVSFNCDYTDDLQRTTRNVFIEIPEAQIDIQFDWKNNLTFNVSALAYLMDAENVMDHYVKISW
jgi:hypothetical protein